MIDKMKEFLVFSFLLMFCCVYALYDRNNDVIDLTPSTFPTKVEDSKDVWIVEFYAPWCGHCQALVSEYSKAATALKGIAKVGAVNADEHKSLGGQFGVRGFPTIKIFGADKKKPIDYSGPRTANGLVDAAFKELRRSVDEKLGGKKSSGGGSKQKREQGDSKDVIELTDDNFKETVLDSTDMWLVEFFAPWCGHCQRLEPEWAQAATELKGKVKLGALDATVHSEMSQKYDVRGFPTIKFFPAGPKGDAEEYNGGRTAQDIINWALEKVAENTAPPEIIQITSGDVLKEACENHPLCVISVLPHILDCQSSCRNNYLNILKEVGAKYKKTGWGWVWTEAMTYPSLEDALEIGGFGYPAMAVMNVRKMKYSILRGPFSYDGISDFVRTVSVGRGGSVPVKGAKLPEISTTDLWDGKDGELPIEENDEDEQDSDVEPKVEL